MKRILSFFSFFLAVFAVSQFSFGQSEIATIQRYLTAHAADWKVNPEDFTAIEITSRSSSKADGVQHWYVRQLFQGVPVVNGLGTVSLKNDQVVHVASRFVHCASPNLQAPLLSASDAVIRAMNQLGMTAPELVLKAENKELNAFVFDGGTLSKEPIPVRLMVKCIDQTPQYIWEMSVYPVNTTNWWSLHVAASDGTILFKNDWMQHCSFDACDQAVHAHRAQQKETVLLPPPPPPGVDQYTVYALPLVSPNHGNRTTLINPSDASYSPFGWHDTNGQAGDEYTITRGNNVYASEDIDNDDIPGYSPDGGNTLNFNFAYDSLVGVEGNLDAVITNLFYMNNMMHDIWAYYGFDEQSGNFQSMNYSAQGLGDDFVYADAQDGSGTNNANFGTPPDGSNPRMQMYLWTSSNIPNLLTVNAPISIAQSYTASTAGFGPPVPTTPITQDVVLVIDDGTDVNDGCGVITNGAALAGKIALVKRGNCTFAVKVEACEALGAVAVIVANNQPGSPISMGGTSTTNIPSIMISQADGNTFITAMSSATVNATIVDPGDLSATDSDFDNLVIAHEYGHGISNRLTGGADNTDCLYNEDQMGEGWSDWFGLMLTMTPGDLPEDPRGVGTYVTNQANNATGIRPAPYSTDLALNNYTYGSTNNTNLSMPHGIGFVWATMLWDLNWALIQQYVWNPDVKEGTGGNNVAMQLVIEGLKLQPCEPGFVDGRDAILAADELLYAGVNKCLIWNVFANRGLGFSADQGSSNDRTDQVEAFDVPASCLGSGVGISEWADDAFAVFPNPTTDELTVRFKSFEEVNTILITDLAGKKLISSFMTGQEIHVDLSAYKAGMYLIRIETSKGLQVVQVIKK